VEESINVIDIEFANTFAQEWVDAWNSHDLERILSHYADNFEMASPVIVRRMGEPSGRLQGKAAVRPYWAQGLAANPPLRFELLQVLRGVDSIVLYYRNTRGQHCTEMLTLNLHGKVIRGCAHYAAEE
jgi:hypothetical protein